MRSTRIVAAAGALFAGWLGIVVVLHLARPVYDLPTWAAVLGVGAALLAVAGWVQIGLGGAPIGLGAALVGLLFVGGLLALMSIGILLWLLALGGTVVLARRVHDRDPSAPSLRRSLAGAAAVALGVPLAALVAGDGPVVRCQRNGVSTSSGIFRSLAGGSGSESGSGTTSVGSSGSGSFGSRSISHPDGRSEGVVTSGGRRYTFVCQGDRLVSFTATDEGFGD